MKNGSNHARNETERCNMFFLGHKITPMIVEDDITIYTKGCERCGCGIGLPYWKSYKCPPPARKGESQEMVNKEWKEYVDQRCAEIRSSIKKPIR